MRFSLPFKLKMKVFYVTTLIFFVYLCLFYLVIDIWLQKTKTKETLNSTIIDLPLVIVHFDLKGAAPKLEYLTSLLPELKKLGANGLLIEYEDMFPYEGRLVNLSASFCYTKTELHSFITYAINLGFEIIPLVQTFGHLEFALKLLQFQHLREDPSFPDSICPSMVESTAFVRHMLEQVIQFHNEIKPLSYIHIGCDEVFHVNKCDRCRQRNQTDTEIMLQHVNKTANAVKNLSPNTKVLIWDDILRSKDPLLLYPVNLNVEPVSWWYGPDIDVSINFYKYPPNFKNIWVASAFKGADGSTSIIPNLENRFRNNLSWLKLILEYIFIQNSKTAFRKFNFKGIILTGWSRYSHMDPLCDILPAALPSLVINLMLIKKISSGVHWKDLAEEWFIFYAEHIKPDADDYFGCEVTGEVTDTNKCDPLKNPLNEDLKLYMLIRKDIVDMFYNDKDDYSALDYYFKLGLINKNSMHNKYLKCYDSLHKLLDVEKKIGKTLSKFYGKHVLKEYLDFLTYHYKNLLRNSMKNLESFNQIKHWDKK